MTVSLWSMLLVAGTVVALVAGAAGGVLAAEVRAQDAADAAALAAAHAGRGSGDPVRAARAAATQYGATLHTCNCTGANVEVVVEVVVPTPAARLAGRRAVTATAAATLVPLGPGRRG